MSRLSPLARLLHQLRQMRAAAFIGVFGFLAVFPAWAQNERALEYRVRGVRSQQEGDLEKAVQYFRKAAKLDPAYAAPYNDLGIVLERLGKLPQAEEAYRSALRIDSGYAPAHSNLARLYERMKRPQEAVREWEKRACLGSRTDPGRLEASRAANRLRQGVNGVDTRPVPREELYVTPKELEPQRAKELAQMFLEEKGGT